MHLPPFLAAAEGTPRGAPHAPDAAAIRATAARVIRTEAAALAMLADRLPEDFAPAVARILGCAGRVILTGIGKSGHIARKIAATLASTGTPAAFIHAAEASHGDLGAIMAGDIVLAVSNSGETAELGDLVAHTRRFGLGLIGLSAAADSTLMQAADLRLLLPPAPEACAMGLAPTTSTTMALALGDALAIALCEARGFLPEHFRTFHPGGRLAARLARVAQIMRGSEALPLVAPDMPMGEVILTMTARGLGVAGVVADGRLVGIITDGDLRRHMTGLLDRRAAEVATPDPLTAPPQMLAAEAVAAMNARKVHMVFVVDDAGRPLGALALHDCLRAGVV
jgi:arabinose-5-phosphate isomerase